jgi:hypothetical protein
MTVMVSLLVAVALASLSPARQADFECLRVGATLQVFDRNHPQSPPAWTQAPLARLKRADPSRDWRAEAKPFGDITYGEFLEHANTCQRAMPRRRER